VVEGEQSVAGERKQFEQDPIRLHELDGSAFMVMYGRPGGPYELRVFPQFKTSSDIWLTPNVTNIPVTLGQWHKIEWLLVSNTTTDPPNGICRWWLDGQLIGDYTNVKYPSEPFFEYKVRRCSAATVGQNRDGLLLVRPHSSQREMTAFQRELAAFCVRCRPIPQSAQKCSPYDRKNPQLTKFRQEYLALLARFPPCCYSATRRPC